MNPATFPLSIVIPAYKPDFLKKALESIENQTDKRFQVFIGDDASPANLQAITNPFVKRNGWEYHRFNKNLGGQNLVDHWNRCVELSVSQWVWLFSDDDVMSPDCVKTFYAELEKGRRVNVLRFNLQVINEKDEVVNQNLPCPSQVSAFELGNLRFTRQLLSSAVEYVFHRDAFEKEGGFVNFPLAWCSDDASWIAFARDQPIYTLPAGLVSWRLSEVNISSKGGAFTQPKIEAAISFIAWFNQRFPNQIKSTLRGEQIIWLRLQMIPLQYVPTAGEIVRICKRLKLTSPSNFLRTFNDLFCKAYVYVHQVNVGKKFGGFRYWLSRKLPQF